MLLHEVDDENPEIVRDENCRIAREARRMIEEIRPRLEEALSGLKVEGLEKLDLGQAQNDDFEPPEADGNDDWLLNTGLDYFEQLELYRNCKQRGGGRGGGQVR